MNLRLPSARERSDLNKRRIDPQPWDFLRFINRDHFSPEILYEGLECGIVECGCLSQRAELGGGTVATLQLKRTLMSKLAETGLWSLIDMAGWLV